MRDGILTAAVLLAVFSESCFADKGSFCGADLVVPTVDTNACVNLWSKELVAGIGCDLHEVKEESPNRSLRALEHGEIDLMFSMSYTRSRDEMFQLSIPFASHEIGLVKRKSDQTRNPQMVWCDDASKSLTVLTYANVATLPDSPMNEDLTACTAEVAFIPKGPEQALSLLMRGRGDLLMMSQGTWQEFQTLRPDFVSSLEFTDLKIWRDELHILARPNLPIPLMESINSWITDYLSANGQVCNLTAPRERY